VLKTLCIRLINPQKRKKKAWSFQTMQQKDHVGEASDVEVRPVGIDYSDAKMPFSEYLRRAGGNNYRLKLKNLGNDPENLCAAGQPVRPCMEKVLDFTIGTEADLDMKENKQKGRAMTAEEIKNSKWAMLIHEKKSDDKFEVKYIERNRHEDEKTGEESKTNSDGTQFVAAELENNSEPDQAPMLTKNMKISKKIFK